MSQLIVAELFVTEVAHTFAITGGVVSSTVTILLSIVSRLRGFPSLMVTLTTFSPLSEAFGVYVQLLFVDTSTPSKVQL